jgi:hypothetical protein
MSSRAVRVGVATVVAAVALAGCAHPVVVDAAEYAADPDCAPVMLAVPDTVGGLDVRGTTSQATQAWGEEYEIVARCGVEPPGPTTDQCIAVETPAATVAWLLRETDDAWVAVTFGLSPALELTVPKVRADEAVGDVLAELSPAAARAPSNGLECS